LTYPGSGRKVLFFSEQPVFPLHGHDARRGFGVIGGADQCPLVFTGGASDSQDHQHADKWQ
jgi:hypothetical protein